LAAVRALQQHFGIKLPKKHLANIQIEENATEKPAKAENKQKSKPINKKPVKLRKSRRKPRYDDGDDWI